MYLHKISWDNSFDEEKMLMNNFFVIRSTVNTTFSFNEFIHKGLFLLYNETKTKNNNNIKNRIRFSTSPLTVVLLGSTMDGP